ncbi:hypothetical protein MAP00_006527 [Monascus purpureus]|nr:hypothetical protein MAP00_006527 [Monascus purpureus]
MSPEESPSGSLPSPLFVPDRHGSTDEPMGERPDLNAQRQEQRERQSRKAARQERRRQKRERKERRRQERQRRHLERQREEERSRREVGSSENAYPVAASLPTGGLSDHETPGRPLLSIEDTPTRQDEPEREGSRATDVTPGDVFMLAGNPPTAQTGSVREGSGPPDAAIISPDETVSDEGVPQLESHPRQPEEGRTPPTTTTELALVPVAPQQPEEPAADPIGRDRLLGERPRLLAPGERAAKAVTQIDFNSLRADPGIKPLGGYEGRPEMATTETMSASRSDSPRPADVPRTSAIQAAALEQFRREVENDPDRLFDDDAISPQEPEDLNPAGTLLERPVVGGGDAGPERTNPPEERPLDAAGQSSKKAFTLRGKKPLGAKKRAKMINPQRKARRKAAVFPEQSVTNPRRRPRVGKGPQPIQAVPDDSSLRRVTQTDFGSLRAEMAGRDAVTVESEPTAMHGALEKIASDAGPDLAPSTRGPARTVDSRRRRRSRAVGIGNARRIARRSQRLAEARRVMDPVRSPEAGVELGTSHSPPMLVTPDSRPNPQPVSTVFKAHIGGEWRVFDQVAVDRSDPFHVERIAKRYVRDNGAKFYDRNLKPITPARCFQAATEDETNTLFMTLGRDLVITQEMVASASKSRYRTGTKRPNDDDGDDNV